NRDKSRDEHRNENRDKSRDEHRNENRDKSRNEHRNENRDNSKDENGAKHEDDNGDENGEGNPRKFLRLYMCVRKKQLYISVTNATSEVIRKLDWEYISNKRGNHGHGLKRIDLTVAKCGGYINRQNEPGVFATEIMLPLV
ncbi:MAG: GHKL domain-containing protein, partial [Lachnospiraceae bacterium]|nr:GHKL domain-containing protein [Lachnospiraceae bacterium]